MCFLLTLYGVLVPLQAKRKPLFFEKELYNNQLLWSPNPLLDSDANLESIETHGSQATSDKLLLSCEPICRFLDHSNHQELSFYDASSIQSEVALEKNKDADEQVIEPFNQYLVPSSLIDRWGSAMGIQKYFMFNRNCYSVSMICIVLSVLTVDYRLYP